MLITITHTHTNQTKKMWFSNSWVFKMCKSIKISIQKFGLKTIFSLPCGWEKVKKSIYLKLSLKCKYWYDEIKCITSNKPKLIRVMHSISSLNSIRRLLTGMQITEIYSIKAHASHWKYTKLNCILITLIRIKLKYITDAIV